MYPLVQNKFLVMTYLKEFWALKITSNCLKKKKHIIQTKKTSKGFLKILETITRKGTNNTKTATTTEIAQTVASDKRENSQRSTTKGRYHCAKFIGQKLKKYYENWKRYTKDPHILGIIMEALKIDSSKVPFPSGYEIHLRSAQESNNLLAKVRKPLEKGVIVKSKPEFGDYIYGVFARDKKDITKHLILNLKSLNQSVKYKHFKMESIQNLLNVVKPGVFMASIDLKNPFFSVPIYEDHQKLLMFSVKYYYRFVCMPNGYGPAMRIFTKITKIPFTHLKVFSTTKR